MVEAWKIYNVPKSVIMFVVEDVTYNICDQKFDKSEILMQKPDLYFVRKTLAKQGKLDGKQRLIVDGQEEAVRGLCPMQVPSGPVLH